MMVAMGKDDVYLVDLFTVLGGTQHDWVIHGSADRDVAADLNVPLQKFGENLLPGVKVRLPEHERDSGDAEGRNINYAFFQHVSQGDGSNGLQVRFQDEGHIGVRTHVIGQTDGAVFLGDAPSVRRADEDEPLLDPIRMPMFLIRRKGSSPLESQFLAVHEPFSENASIDRIEKVAVKQGVYLKVYHGDFVDHILLQANSEGLEIGDLSFQGEAGFVREQGGNLKAMGLWAGNQLGWQGSTLAGEGAFEGQVKGVRRIQDGDPHDALIVDGLPGGRSLAGATVVVTFGDEMTLGFRVVEQDGHALVLETDPGFRVTGTGMEHCFFPLRTIEGPVRFKLRTSVFMQFNGTDSDMTSIGRANFQVD